MYRIFKLTYFSCCSTFKNLRAWCYIVMSMWWSKTKLFHAAHNDDKMTLFEVWSLKISLISFGQLWKERNLRRICHQYFIKGWPLWMQVQPNCSKGISIVTFISCLTYNMIHRPRWYQWSDQILGLLLWNHWYHFDWLISIVFVQITDLYFTIALLTHSYMMIVLWIHVIKSTRTYKILKWYLAYVDNCGKCGKIVAMWHDGGSYLCKMWFDDASHNKYNIFDSNPLKYLAKMSLVSSVAFLVQVFIMLSAASDIMAAGDFLLPENLDVPAGYTMYKCADIVGNQIYAWVNDEWVYQEPSAVMYKSKKLKEIGTFEAGPTWEFTKKGMTVVAQREMARTTVDPDSFDWLLIEGIVEPGVYEYIKQTDTVGGLPPPNSHPYSYSYSSSHSNSPAPEPTLPMTSGLLEVPFSAEHCFYRRTDPWFWLAMMQCLKWIRWIFPHIG